MLGLSPLLLRWSEGAQKRDTFCAWCLLDRMPVPPPAHLRALHWNFAGTIWRAALCLAAYLISQEREHVLCSHCGCPWALISSFWAGTTDKSSSSSFARWALPCACACSCPTVAKNFLCFLGNQIADWGKLHLSWCPAQLKPWAQSCAGILVT